MKNLSNYYFKENSAQGSAMEGIVYYFFLPIFVT